MEDAATAEISRTQIWHWLNKEVVLEDGRKFDNALFNTIFDEEMEKILTEVGPSKIKDTQFKRAFDLFRELILADDFEEFLTIPAYKYI
ncbi:MAG: malate synthase A, partial [Zobellia laminariae]